MMMSQPLRPPRFFPESPQSLLIIHDGTSDALLFAPRGAFSGVVFKLARSVVTISRTVTAERERGRGPFARPSLADRHNPGLLCMMPPSAKIVVAAT